MVIDNRLGYFLALEKFGEFARSRGWENDDVVNYVCKLPGYVAGMGGKPAVSITAKPATVKKSAATMTFTVEFLESMREDSFQDKFVASGCLHNMQSKPESGYGVWEYCGKGNLPFCSAAHEIANAKVALEARGVGFDVNAHRKTVSKSRKGWALRQINAMKTAASTASGVPVPTPAAARHPVFTVPLGGAISAAPTLGQGLGQGLGRGLTRFGGAPIPEIGSVTPTRFVPQWTNYFDPVENRIRTSLFTETTYKLMGSGTPGNIQVIGILSDRGPTELSEAEAAKYAAMGFVIAPPPEAQ